MLELTAVNQVQALKAGRIDIGFGRIRLDDPDIAQKVLFDEPTVAALPAHHPLVGTIPTLAQLAEYPNDHLSGIASSKLCRCRVQPQGFESQGHSGNQRTIDRDRSGRLGSWFQSGAGAVMRIQRDEVTYVRLAERNITSPIICSRRREPVTPAMQMTNDILRELVENQAKGRYP